MKANIRFDLFFVISIILIIIALFLANGKRGYIYPELSPRGSSLDPPIPPTSGDGSGGGGMPGGCNCDDGCRDFSF